MKHKQIVVICKFQTYLNLKNICPSVNISKTIKGEINAILINNSSVDLGYSKNNNSQVILYL